MRFVLGVEFREGGLQLVFEMGSLRVFEDDVCVEAEGLVFRDDCDGLGRQRLLLPRLRGELGICKNLLEEGVFLHHS